MNLATCTNCFGVFPENHLTPIYSLGKEFKDCPKCYHAHKTEMIALREKPKKQKYTSSRKPFWRNIPIEDKEKVYNYIESLNLKRLVILKEHLEYIKENFKIKLSKDTIMKNYRQDRLNHR